ncbi:hypothetical protein SLS58_000297 [Diplodia intermedia]|uniref:Uncharacterized protein n=1 Tax=Diplodia intermedia TaxID=856260 RepID=A0ABR3U6I0_9PEZI
MRLPIHLMLKLGTTKPARSPPGGASASAYQHHTENMAVSVEVEHSEPGTIKPARGSRLIGRLSSKLQAMSSTTASAFKRASQKIRVVLHKPAQKGPDAHAQQHTQQHDQQHDQQHADHDMLSDSCSSMADSASDCYPYTIACGPLPAHDPGYTVSPYPDTSTSMEVCEWASSPEISADINDTRAAAVDVDGADSDHANHRASCLNRASKHLYHVPSDLNIRLPQGATGSKRLPPHYPRGAKSLKRPDDSDFPSWHQAPDGYMVPTPRLPRGVFLPEPSRLRQVETIEYAEDDKPLSQNVSRRTIRRTKAMLTRRHVEPIRLVSSNADEEQTSTSSADDTALSSICDDNWVAYGDDSEELSIERTTDFRPYPLGRATHSLSRSRGVPNLHSMQDDIILEEDSEEETSNAVAESMSGVNWMVIDSSSFTSLAEEGQEANGEDKQAPVCSAQRAKANAINALRPFSTLFAIVTGESSDSEEDVADLEHMEPRSGASTPISSIDTLSAIQVKAFDGEDNSECDASSFSILSQELEGDVSDISATASLSQERDPVSHEAESGMSSFLEGSSMKLEPNQQADILSAIADDFDHDDNELIRPCSLPALPAGVKYADERHPTVSWGPRLVIPEKYVRVVLRNR